MIESSLEPLSRAIERTTQVALKDASDGQRFKRATRLHHHLARDVPATSTVIGPASAGKTCFLVTLDQALHRLHDMQARADGGNESAVESLHRRGLPRTPLRIEARNKGMRSIQLMREAVLADGWTTAGMHQVEASSEVERIEFALASPKGPRYDFTILDGPGGSLFPQLGRTQDDEGDHYFRHRRELRQALEKTSGLMVCLDGSDSRAAAEIAKGLRAIATDLRERGRPPIERAIICLTKADKRYVEAGRNARGCAERSDPWELATKLLTADGVDALRSIVKGTVCARWISSYGFLPDGSANFDPATGGFLADDLGPADTARFWDPYGVLEAFLFLADGKTRGAFEIR